MYTSGVTNLVKLNADELSLRDLEDFSKDFKFDIATSIVILKQMVVISMIWSFDDVW